MSTVHFSEAIYGDKASFAREMINECTHGKVFSGKFIKTDGSERVFNGRAYATGSIKGTGKPLSGKLVPYIDNEVLIKNLKELEKSLGRKLNKEQDEELIIEARRKSWRSFVGERLVELNINGEKIVFDYA